MDQVQFDLIVKIIQNGAPALAGELVEALVKLVNDAGKYYELLEKVNNKNNTEVNDAV